MPAELRKGQVRARRDETHAFGDFFRAYGTEEFPVERQAARGIHDLHFTAPAGNLDVALGVGNLDAATAIADNDARVGRDRLGGHIDIEAVGVTEDRLVDFDARDAILYEIGQGEEPDQAQQSENQKDFTGANGRTRLRAGALRGDA